MDWHEMQVILQDCRIGYVITDRALHIVRRGGISDMFEQDGAAALGDPLVEHVPELVGSERLLADILEGRLPRLELVCINRETRAGSTCYVTLVDLPVCNGEGEIVGLMHLEQDMTEMGTLQQRLMQSRNELRLAQAQLAGQNDELAARTAELMETNAQLEAFGHTISHDLRAPLQSIEGYAEILLRQSDDWKDAGVQDDLRHIVDAAERMSKMIQELLALSRLRRAELTLQPTPLLAVVQDALAEVDADVRKRQAQVLVEESLPTVMGQHATLVQVVANLVTNAVKFVAPHVVPCVRIWGEEHDGQVCLWVQDNGIGIATADRERIFHAFERLHGVEAYPGSGIGLAIVHTAVQRLGGRVHVESEVGCGSRFCVELQSSGAASA